MIIVKVHVNYGQIMSPTLIILAKGHRKLGLKLFTILLFDKNDPKS